MIQLNGNYCKDCKIFIDYVEDEAMQLIRSIIDSPAFAGQTIRIMSDVHAGAGICIGFTSTLGEYVNPEHVGCDIGCTVSASVLDRHVPVDKYADFEYKVRNAIKFGFETHDKSEIDEKDFYKFLTNEFNKAKSAWPEMTNGLPSVVTEKWVSSQLNRIGMNEGIFYNSLATVGGGNHFIEYDEEPDSNLALMSVHCGSRNLGIKVFNYWNRVAKNAVKSIDMKSIIKNVKETVSDKSKWGDEIKKLTDIETAKHPDGYLTGDALKGYMCDMVFAQAYAKYNHMTIHKIISDILKKYGIHTDKELIMTTHNYIDFEDHVIRKGAVKSVAGSKLLIPFNMRDGIAVCEGLSNGDWNNSAPHGAGRKMSRTKAFAILSVNEFKYTMDGIYSTSICKGTLDESPMAYKDYNTIRKLIEGNTVNILHMCKPKINWKSSSSNEGHIWKN